jgi:CheY-like chemotaxis protein
MPGSVILIVEDEPLIRMGIVFEIEDAGFAVFEAGKADETIKLLEQYEEVSLIFTGINMPGSMDGVKLGHYICSRWPPVKSLSHRLMPPWKKRSCL